MGRDAARAVRRPTRHQCQVHFLATPGQGPGYTEVINSCGVPNRQNPGVVSPGTSALLVSGLYDRRQENPTPDNTTGVYVTLIHMETYKKQAGI